MHWTDLLIAILATQQIVETWSKGSIFATRRMMVQEWNEEGVMGFFRSLLLCRFCLSHWVAFGVTLDLVAAAYLPPGWASALKLLVQALAVTRGAQLLHDLTVTHSRSPSPDAS